jgi:chaperone modulatory protein CbpM
MKIEIHEAVWFDEHQWFSLAELADLSGMPEAVLRQLVDYAALTPVDDDNAAEVRFSAECLITARTAQRLRNDFDLDANGLAMALSLLERVRELERRLQSLGAQFPKSHR